MLLWSQLQTFTAQVGASGSNFSECSQQIDELLHNMHLGYCEIDDVLTQKPLRQALCCLKGLLTPRL